MIVMVTMISMISMVTRWLTVVLLSSWRLNWMASLVFTFANICELTLTRQLESPPTRSLANARTFKVDFSGYSSCQWRTNEYSYRWILEQKIFSKQGKAKKRKKICTAKRETSGPGVVERGKIVRTCAMYFLSFDHSTGRWHNLSRYLCHEM